jgi:hypothetical protein
MIKDDFIFLFFLENMHEKPLRLGRIHENQTHFFLCESLFFNSWIFMDFFFKFQRKPSILISDLYLTV